MLKEIIGAGVPSDEMNEYGGHVVFQDIEEIAAKHGIKLP